MQPKRLELALAAVKELADYAARGDQALAREARKTLNELCCQYDAELGAMTYPAPVRAALRAAGLSETA